MAKGTTWQNLIKEMRFAASELDALAAEDKEWIQGDVASLDDLRYAALELANMAAATMDALQGRIS